MIHQFYMDSASKSFWSKNPCSPRWFDTLGQMWSGAPPRLLETVKTNHRNVLPTGVTLKTAEQGDLPAIIEFWTRYFSITKSCKSAVPLSHLRKMVLEGKWDVLILVGGDGDVLASLVRRKLVGLHVGKARWAEAGCIDYYCVHPAWRRRGLWRALLNAIHNMTPSPIPPHLIFWESLRPSVPPLVAGSFFARKCGAQGAQGAQGQAIQITDPEICKAAWRDCVKGVDVWTEGWGEEVSFWRGGGGGLGPKDVVVVWNTFHQALGGSVGIVLGCAAAEAAKAQGAKAAAATALADSKSPWGVLLLPRPIPFTQFGGDGGAPEGWVYDSLFQWIGYNLSVGFISGKFPVLGF